MDASNDAGVASVGSRGSGVMALSVVRVESRRKQESRGAGRRRQDCVAVLVEQDRNGEAVRTQDEPGDR